MENASQALIIAGAILLAILIIALGMFIFNSARSKMEKSVNSLNETEVKAQNQMIERYTDRRVSGNEVKDLLRDLSAKVSQTDSPKDYAVTVNVNASNLNAGSQGTVEFKEGTGENQGAGEYRQQIIDLQRRIKSNANYIISVQNKADNDAINAINLEDYNK